MSDDKLIENNDLLPEPLDFLANDIEKQNEEYWLDNRSETYGAEDVRYDGFTKNQRRWINKLAKTLKDKKRRIKELEENIE